MLWQEVVGDAKLPSFPPVLLPLLAISPSFLLYFVLLPGLEARVRCGEGAAKSLGPRAKASWAGLGSQISEAIGDHKSRWPLPPQRAAKGA